MAKKWKVAIIVALVIILPIIIINLVFTFASSVFIPAPFVGFVDKILLTPLEPGPPPHTWYFTDEVAITDQGLNFTLMAAPFLAKGEQAQCTLFYAVLAPEELYGWQISPTGIVISDDQGEIFTGQGNALESVSGVTLGAIPLPLFRSDARFLKIAINTMEARDLATGEVKELKGNWAMVPLRNFSPEYRWEGKLGLWETDEVSYKGITLRYIINGDCVWLSGKRGEPPWVLPRSHYSGTVLAF